MSIVKRTAKGTVKSKTIYLALAVIVLGYLQSHKDVVAPLIRPEHLGLLDMVVGLAILVCRFFTSETLAEKGTNPDEDSQ